MESPTIGGSGGRGEASPLSDLSGRLTLSQAAAEVAGLPEVAVPAPRQ